MKVDGDVIEVESLPPAEGLDRDEEKPSNDSRREPICELRGGEGEAFLVRLSRDGVDVAIAGNSVNLACASIVCEANGFDCIADSTCLNTVSPVGTVLFHAHSTCFNTVSPVGTVLFHADSTCFVTVSTLFHQ